jgi:uncharacterized protein (DUF1501 family)
MSKNLSRRRFLGQASCAAVGSVGLLSSLLNLRLAGATVGQSLAATDDYRALVCVFFAGGMDSYNFLLPAEGAPYATYAATRGGVFDPIRNPDGLALSRSDILALPSGASADFNLALHPACADHGPPAGLHSLFRQGHLALLPNVGTLVERVSKQRYRPPPPASRAACSPTPTSSNSGKPPCPSSPAASAGPVSPPTSSTPRIPAPRCR